MIASQDNYQISFKMITRLLDNIGLAMYSSVPRAVAELVANAYDADATIVQIMMPEGFWKKDSKIVVEDNGSGMTLDQLEKQYMVLGFNRRIDKARTSGGRLPIGNKGIGKLAGLGIAEAMIVETVHDGKKCSLIIDKLKLDKENKPLSEISIPVQIQSTVEPNGTTITLSRPLPRAKLVSAHELLTFLTVQFGLKHDFIIRVNGVEQSAKLLPGPKYTFSETISDAGQIRGYYVIAETPSLVEQPGFIIKVRGRTVLGPTVFDVFTSGKRQAVFTTGRISGEIEADFLDPELPKEKYDEFIITTSRDNFNETDPRFQKLKDWTENKLRQIAKEIEKETEKKRRAEIISDKNFKDAYSRLPKHAQQHLMHLLDTLIPSLNELSPENAEFIVDIVLKAAQSSEFLEILKKMHDAGTSDIGKLAALLQDWGVSEIASITSLIKGRLQVIDQFEQFNQNMDTLEYPQIHRTLEKNLWLLDDNYKFYASNQPLKTILDNKILQKFKPQENNRPDLICKDLQDKIVIVELKRPSHKIVLEDLTQLLSYMTIVKAHSPNYKEIKCYLIGNSYDESVRGSGLEQSGYFLRSFSEIIKEARCRYREIIQILERGAEDN